MSNLATEIESVASEDRAEPAVVRRFLERSKQGKFTRDENPASHYCVYFLPYNKETKKIFIIHHKKSGLWISPGGHIDQGETLMQAINREIEEELGMKQAIKDSIQPFLLTRTPIENPVHPCKEHLDVWYRFQTDGADFNIDPREFHATKWVTIAEARTLVTDKPNREMLDRMERFFN
jgi:8-oxo-dGTP diphosphatase